VVSAGVIAMACGIVLLPLISHPWQVYAAFAVMSFGWAAMSGAAINIIIAPWFDKRRGLAISLALNGASAGGIVITPLLIVLIERLHLAAALLCIAGVMVAVLLPTASFLRRKHPGERDRAHHSSEVTQTRLSAAPAWSPLAILRSWNFSTISVPFALALMAQVGFLTHQVAYLSPILGAVGAGWAVSATTFSAIIGRILTGLFVDRLDRRAVACANFLIQFAGTGLLASNASAAMLYLGCILFGLGLGNLISLPGLIVQQEFPKQHFSRITGLIVAINQFTFAFGPGLLGYLQQTNGGYTAALVACLILQAAAAAIVILPQLGRMSGRMVKRTRDVEIRCLTRHCESHLARVRRQSHRHQPPEARHRDFAAETSTQTLDRAPQHRLVAADDRLAEHRLQLLDGFDLGGVGAAQEIAVSIIAGIVERGLHPALGRRGR